MPRSLIIVIMGIAMHLGGCGFLAGHRDLPVIAAPENTQLGKRITHLVEWRADDKAETFIAVMETHADNLKLVAVLPTGISLFSLDYHKDDIKQETSPLYSANIKPLQLLAILQMVNYPAGNITQQLPEHWHMTETGQQRLLEHKDKTQISVQFTGADVLQPVIVTDLAQGQTFTITRLSMEDAP